MNEHHNRIRDIQPQHEWFIGIDSDGCVFDTMEIKHKRCFCPAYIREFDLGEIAEPARQVWEFANLYSRTRGINRFKGLALSMKYLAAHPDVLSSAAAVPQLGDFMQWVDGTEVHDIQSLEQAMGNTPGPQLEKVRNWSVAVNRAIEEVVRGVDPFGGVRNALARMSGQADCMVVSSAPIAQIEKEWGEQGLLKLVAHVAGQEAGSKKSSLESASGGKYAGDARLMIGDAPGDLAAAQAAGVLFFPIIPGKEEQSWKRLTDEGLDRFFQGNFAGEYQRRINEEFLKALPENPPWERSAP